ncbi:hypothetical protein EGR_08925 [Echinococcus granulosus]|uniref:Uncharacterized protein n=1 Tax=Echinococcus granulosus TaxID=6210 RepID=W6U4Y3_ECHGR|nr:hypothetical protein EGR_08925 [Echinococcus granulosus]EUB56223.1 hypothetical protein EGR_08925 [Echinococcus granulosus]
MDAHNIFKSDLAQPLPEAEITAEIQRDFRRASSRHPQQMPLSTTVWCHTQPAKSEVLSFRTEWADAQFIPDDVVEHKSLEEALLFLLANVYQAQSLLPNHPASTTTSATTAAAVAGTMTSTAATTGLGDVDKTNTFSLPTTQSPVLLHSSPFSTTTAPDLERLALRQELEETRCKLNASLQDLEALRCECAEQTQQTLGLQLVVRQIVMILFNHLAEVRRLQEKPPLTPPSATATGTTTPSSARDASLTFLNDLLRVLLYDPTVRSALSSDGITGSTGASTTTPAASVTKRPSSLRRKSCSNPPGSWSGGGVLEDLEEEDQSRLGAMEESTSFEDDLRLTLFSSSHHHRQHHHHHQQHQHAIEHSSSVGNINNNGNSNILNP